jgi:hypothetical protein
MSDSESDPIVSEHDTDSDVEQVSQSSFKPPSPAHDLDMADLASNFMIVTPSKSGGTKSSGTKATAPIPKLPKPVAPKSLKRKASPAPKSSSAKKPKKARTTPDASAKTNKPAKASPAIPKSNHPRRRTTRPLKTKAGDLLYSLNGVNWCIHAGVVWIDYG